MFWVTVFVSGDNDFCYRVSEMAYVFQLVSITVCIGFPNIVNR